MVSSWIQWEKSHKHGRQLAVGIGAYLNSKEANLAQIARALERVGRRIDGVCFFSYAKPFASERGPGCCNADSKPGDRSCKRMLYLSAGTVSDHGVFDQPAPRRRERTNLGAGRSDVAETALNTHRALIDPRIPLYGAGEPSPRGDARGRGDGALTQGFSNLNPGKNGAGIQGSLPRRTVLDVDRSKVPELHSKNIDGLVTPSSVWKRESNLCLISWERRPATSGS